MELLEELHFVHKIQDLHLGSKVKTMSVWKGHDDGGRFPWISLVTLHPRKFNSKFTPEKLQRAPIGKDSLPTTIFQGLWWCMTILRCFVLCISSLQWSWSMTDTDSWRLTRTFHWNTSPGHQRRIHHGGAPSDFCFQQHFPCIGTGCHGLELYVATAWQLRESQQQKTWPQLWPLKRC